MSDITRIDKIGAATGASYEQMNAMENKAIPVAGGNTVWRPLLLDHDIRATSIRQSPSIGDVTTELVTVPWDFEAQGAWPASLMSLRVLTEHSGRNEKQDNSTYYGPFRSIYITNNSDVDSPDCALGVEVSMSMTMMLPDSMLSSQGDKFRWSPFRGASTEGGLAVTGQYSCTAIRLGDA